MNKKGNKTFNFILGLIISLLMIAGSIHSFVYDEHINLEKSKFVIGKVAYSDTRSIEIFTLRYTQYRRVFYFKLENSDQNFVIHRSYEGYDDLQSTIRAGDTIKVYYRSGFQKYNDHVFQVEKMDKVIISHKEYSESSSIKAGIGLFTGTVFLIGLIMWFVKFDLIKFLLNIVSVPGRSG